MYQIKIKFIYLFRSAYFYKKKTNIGFKHKEYIGMFRISISIMNFSESYFDSYGVI